METRKVLVDGVMEEVLVATSDECLENNQDILLDSDDLGDTHDLTGILAVIGEGDKSE